MYIKACNATIICGVSVRRISNYMHSVALDHMDGHDEINLTALAEDAANMFELYEGEDDSIPEEVFELSSDVAEMFK